MIGLTEIELLEVNFGFSVKLDTIGTSGGSVIPSEYFNLMDVNGVPLLDADGVELLAK